MTAGEIKERLKKKKLTQKALADRFGVNHTTIHFLVHGKMKSRRLEIRLARAIGVKVETLREGWAA